MSIQGKGSLSYKKQNVQKQNAPHTGVKNITFAHLFSNAGETTIPFDALVTPPEWSTSGLVNPTSQSLLSAQLQVFKNNVTVTSSARGLIQKSEYIVHGNRIEFKNITSLVNEYFEVEVADILITGNLIVDMQTIRVEGELQDTETDFNMGYEFDVLNEEIIVFRDGIQMFRSDNNDSSGTTGNYYYVDTDGDGRSSLLRFFEPSVGVEPVLIASTGGVVDNANVSTFQQIEHLAGQLDAIVPTVAALAGVPESNFRSGPNNVDLKTFGDLLINLDNKYDTTEKLSEYTKTKYQTKILSAPQSNYTGEIVELRFSNLTIGKYYEIVSQWYIETSDSSGPSVTIVNGAQTLGRVFKDGVSILEASQFGHTTGTFEATAATVVFNLISANGTRVVDGDGTKTKSWVQIRELPNHEETTDFT
jgi:hypothetical protein